METRLLKHGLLGSSVFRLRSDDFRSDDIFRRVFLLLHLVVIVVIVIVIVVVVVVFVIFVIFVIVRRNVVQVMLRTKRMVWYVRTGQQF